MLHKIKEVQGKRTGHISCRNCILKHAFDGKIEEIREEERTRKKLKQLLDILKDNRRHWSCEGKAI
jgi:hypothetical protein